MSNYKWKHIRGEPQNTSSTILVIYQNVSCGWETLSNSVAAKSLPPFTTGESSLKKKQFFRFYPKPNAFCLTICEDFDGNTWGFP